jgi:hypothetical protein
MKTKEQVLVRVTRTEMKSILMEVNTNQFISMVSRTPQKMNDYLDYWLIQENGKKKKNPNPTVNPYKDSGIYKEQHKIDVLTGFGSYDDIVMERGIKEGWTEDQINEWLNRNQIKRDEYLNNSPDTIGKSQVEIDEIMSEYDKKHQSRFTLLSNSLLTDSRTESKFYLRYVYTVRTHSKPSVFTHEMNEVDRQVFQGFLTKKNTNSYQGQGLDHTFNIQQVELENIVELTMNGTKYILTH